MHISSPPVLALVHTLSQMTETETASPHPVDYVAMMVVELPHPIIQASISAVAAWAIRIGERLMPIGIGIVSPERPDNGFGVYERMTCAMRLSEPPIGGVYTMTMTVLYGWSGRWLTDTKTTTSEREEYERQLTHGFSTALLYLSQSTELQRPEAALRTWTSDAERSSTPAKVLA